MKGTTQFQPACMNTLLQRRAGEAELVAQASRLAAVSPCLWLGVSKSGVPTRETATQRVATRPQAGGLRHYAAVAAMAALAWLLLLTLTGCESTDGGGGNVSGGVYYGVGFYDPWYYGGYYEDIDIDIDRPDRPGQGPRPEHPIARPTPSRPTATPSARPSIPSMPRGGGRRR